MMNSNLPAEVGGLSRSELEERVAGLMAANAELQRRLEAAGPPEGGPPSAEFLLQAMLDSTPDRIYFKDTQSRFIKCSRVTAERMGLKDANAIIGRTDFDFLPEDRARMFYEHEQRIMQSGEPLINEPQKKVLPDGDVIWTSATKVPLRDATGKIIGLVGINRDITEHKLENEALRRSRDEMEWLVAERTAELTRERLLLRRLIDNLPDAVYVKDARGRKILANPTDLVHCGGKTEAEVLGKTDFDLYPREVAEIYWADDQQVLRGKPVIDREEYFLDEAGQKQWVLTTKLPLHDNDGNTTGLVGIGRLITQRKQAEEALDAERRLMRTLIDHLPDAVYVKDTEGRKVLLNQADVKNCGCPTAAAAIGKNDFDLFPREVAEKYWADDQQVLRGEPVIDREEYFLDAAGRKEWVLTTKLPLLDAEGRISGLVGIGRLVTRRKQAEEALDRERRLLRTLVDHLPDSIYVKDAEGRKILANPANLRNIRCRTEADAIGKSDFDFFSRHEAEAFWADDQRVLQGEPVLDREESFLDAAGAVHWSLTSKLPLHDAEGRIVGLVGIGREITRRKEAEQALDRERRLLRTLIDNLPDCIYAKDAAGRKTLANPADLKNLRCKTEADAIGKSDFDLFPPAVAEKFWADDQRVLRGEPVINREEFFFDETGEKRWLLSSKLPLPDESGAIVGLIGIARDITVIKKAEEKLSEHMRELEQRDHQTREELNMARELQLAMLPQEFPSLPSHKPAAESHLEFFSFYCPSGAVSGDFFDVVPLSDHAVGLFICDAMGHDVRAALVTAMMRALVADLSATLMDPGDLLTQVNLELAGIFKQSGSIMYATAFYLIVDLARKEFRYASAAHPDPILVHRGSNTVEWLKVDAGGKKGPALGLFMDGRFATYRRPMAVGDLIALYTDGLVEVEGPGLEMFTADRLLAAVRQRVGLPGNELFTGVIEEIKTFAASPKFDDDICLASVEVRRLEMKS